MVLNSYRPGLSVAATILTLLTTLALHGVDEGKPVNTDTRLLGNPTSIEEVIRRVSQRVVALRVERDKDEAEVTIPETQLRMLPETDRQNLINYYRRPEGVVSGVLIDDAGHVLTSHYNVAGEVRSVEVILSNGTSLVAKVVSHNPLDDLALLQLEEEVPESLELAPLNWEQGDNYRPGRFVLAIGRSPDPLRPTATLGIISAPTRNLGRAFQTDAKMNYGNAGGALVSLDGRILGITSFIGHTYPHWGLNSGIGFGTRADTVLEVLPSMLRSGVVKTVDHAFLGVFSSRREFPGAVVSRVVEGSAADLAGIEDSDLIVEFDHVPVEDFVHLRHLIYRRNPGDEVLIRVRRRGEELDIRVVLGRNTLTKEQ